MHAKIRPEPYGEWTLSSFYGMVDLPTEKWNPEKEQWSMRMNWMQEMVDTAEGHTKELGKIRGVNPEQAAELYESAWV